MTRRMDTYRYPPGRVGVNLAAADTSTDSNTIGVAGFQTMAIYFKFVGDAGDSATSALTWSVKAGFDGDTDEYPLTSVAISSGAGTWNARTPETFTLGVAGTSENFTARYDITDFDWIEIHDVTGTSGDSASTITLNVAISNPGA